MTKFIHIGFGKTGTSKLQKDIFPVLCQDIKIKYFGPEYQNEERRIYSNLLTNHVAKMMLGTKCDYLNLPKNIFISHEELSSYRDPQLFEEFAEKNLVAFGKDAHIILTIRSPKDWLSSIYLQLCAHEKPMQKPEYFFLTNTNYSERLPYAKFNIDKFSYKKIISLYQNRFDNVSVIKYEDFKSLNFIKEIFQVGQSEINKYKVILNKGIVNRGFSELSFKISWKFQSLLFLLGLSFKNKYTNESLLERSNNSFLTQKYKTKQNKGMRILNIISYKFIFQVLINNILKYKKYNLDFAKLKYIDIKKLEEEYQKLPNFQTYTKEK